ncbi:MAG: FecR family protein [Parcubacteria group bacterium]
MSPRLPDIAGDPADPRDVAAAWFSRERSGEMTADEAAALQAWLEADPLHAEAYAQTRQAWAEAAAVRADPQVMAIREHWLSSHAQRRRRQALRAVAASVMAVVVAGGGFAGWRYATGPKPLGDRTFQTAVGERRVVKLPDGSEVTLNTNSVLRTRADHEKRLVYLERGQAFFQVAHDASHPFVVTAAGRTVTALGTAFDVRVDGGPFRVTLVEGKVRVEAAAPAMASAAAGPKSVKVQATEMVAGSQLIAPDDEQWRLTRADVLTETSWTRGQLVFENQPLTDVVRELNRYSAQKMVVADASLARTPISGTFKIGDADHFIHALEAYGVARRGAASTTSVELEPVTDSGEKN